MLPGGLKRRFSSMSRTAFVFVRQNLGRTPSSSIARVPMGNIQLSQWTWPSTTTEPGRRVWPLCDPASLGSNARAEHRTENFFIAEILVLIFHSNRRRERAPRFLLLPDRRLAPTQYTTGSAATSISVSSSASTSSLSRYKQGESSLASSSRPSQVAVKRPLIPTSTGILVTRFPARLNTSSATGTPPARFTRS